jgi:hypothetical protein
MQALKALFGSMGIYPNDDMLNDLLLSCGKNTDEDIISFELFARSVALLLEESAEHGSTSSQNEDAMYEGQMVEEAGEGDEEEMEMGEDPYYNEYDVHENY